MKAILATLETPSFCALCARFSAGLGLTSLLRRSRPGSNRHSELLCSPDELLAAYPYAKVVLTNRDVDFMAAKYGAIVL